MLLGHCSCCFKRLLRSLNCAFPGNEFYALFLLIGVEESKSEVSIFSFLLSERNNAIFSI